MLNIPSRTHDLKSFKDRIQFSLYFYSCCFIKLTWKALCLMKLEKSGFQTSLYPKPQLSINWTDYFKIILKKPFMRERPSSRLEPAFSSLPGATRSNSSSPSSPCTNPGFSVLFQIWLAENMSSWKSKLSPSTHFLQPSLAMSETFTLEDFWAFPPPSVLYWYCSPRKG